MNSTLSIFGLVLLLLLSPCKVRNFIQAELGIPQTNVLNKSQSTISQSNCQTFEFSETIQTITKPTFQQSDFLISEASHFDFTSYLLRNSFNLNTSRNLLVFDVPFYILYQNLKVYS
ncbi:MULTISPECIES: hypothetical protein [Flavobacterium]|uniref:Lipoprotein n=1 Tax=Flavobacterium jumunjinense TaxID=998845 RepID=A0ABV5GM09_9FLAO|nr:MULTISPECIES: hypothetical protein [Flavobacterium]